MEHIKVTALKRGEKSSQDLKSSPRIKAKSFLAGVILALMIGLLSPAAAMAQSVNLSSSSGSPGTSLTVSGSGFVNGDTYSIEFAPGTDYDSLLIPSGTISGTSFSQPINIPAIPWGQYIIRVVTSRGTFSPTFTVVPSTDINQTIGAVGDTVVLSGVGFRANIEVNALFDNTEVANVMTDSYGTFSGLDFTVPSTNGGTHTIRVTDGIAFTDQSFTIQPQLTASPQSGAVNDQITLNGTGFTANSPIIIFWDNGTVSTGAIVTNPKGSFTRTNFTVPVSVQGSHTIRARDGTFSSATTSFIVSPKIILSSSTGVPGDEIEIVGRGFRASRSISMTFSGGSVTTTPESVTTDTSGSFTIRFTVPAVAAGNYTVRANDGLYDASAVFSIKAAVALSPDSGHVGSEVTVRGSGFTPDGRVSISYDTAQVVTVTASSMGTFSVSFTVPASPGGSHSVTANDLTSQGVSAAGTFTMETVPPPTPLLVQPEYDSQASVTPLFEWSDVTDPSGVKYQLQVARDAAFSRIVLSEQNLTESHYQVTQGESLTLTKKDSPFYWRVRAVDNADNAGQWTSPASFYTEDSTPPDTPTLLRPQYGASVSGETYFDWTDVTDPSGVTYQLQVAIDVNFNSLLLVKQGINMSEYTITRAEKLPNTSGDSPYYWRVRAVDGADNPSDWTNPGAFYVGLLRGWVLYLVIGMGGLLLFLIGIFIGIRFIARKSEAKE